MNAYGRVLSWLSSGCETCLPAAQSAEAAPPDQLRGDYRTGHHCAQPVMDFFNVPATTRASLAFYNTFGEIDALVAGLHKVKEIFA